MTKSGGSTQKPTNGITGSTPSPNISKIGIVSRDYSRKYNNGYRDFSQAMPGVLTFLDEKGCDAILFSLYSIVIVPRDSFRVVDVLNQLALINIKAVFLEEFKDGKKRKACRFVVYHLTDKGWEEYGFYQKFGTIAGKRQEEISGFVKNEIPKRILGNCCVLLCGETNGVKYSPKDKIVKDTFGLKAAIPHESRIVLNPVHDRMTRFEMKLKRKFLSEHGRWVVSVWNKGKKDRNGNIRDGQGPAWTVFHNEEEKKVGLIPNVLAVEIGILDLMMA